MKLTKSKLINLLKPGMEDLGFHWFKDSITGAQGLFVKKVDNTLYLTIGLNIHRYYNDAFTADLYLSRTTTIYSTWGDIPKDCIKRPEELLLDSEYPSNCRRSWWSSEESMDVFLQEIRISEHRMCMDEDLIRRINNSKDVENLCKISSFITNNLKDLPKIDYSFVPEKEIDEIPLCWFKSTEWTLMNLGMDINSKAVKFYASDAYRKYIIDKTW
ncbi:hypothetical protein [Xylanibacter ruminicola]|uniref:DUF4304 domain-containing protein n=1 Tax=Xylanibacter ruminicola TaxID=839 RepID=A0A1M6Z7V6_XYLRU|nr:hypothetical protein [Xylanibacter ruminicola]SHL26521.1 hypothetical protein SAMN05216463_1438 [Xylanibacter ruminicola]